MRLGDYLTVMEAARFPGVHPETLRRWDWAGKVVPARHAALLSSNSSARHRRDDGPLALHRPALPLAAPESIPVCGRPSPRSC